MMTHLRAVLPGWVNLTIHDTGQYINGVGFKESDWHPEGLPIIRIQNLTNSTKPFNRTKRIVDPNVNVVNGDILVSWSATLDAFRWDRGPAVLNQHIFKVIPNVEKVDPAFLFYLLKEVIAELRQSAHVHGSTMKHINRGPFLAHQVTIPESIDIQLRIVAEIETQLARLDAAVAALKSARIRLKRYRASVLKAACEGRLVPTEAELARRDGREYEPASVLLKRIQAERAATPKKPGKAKDAIALDTSELPILPEGWAWTTLADIADIKGGVTKGQKRKNGDATRDVPYLRVANVQRGYLDLSEIKTIPAIEVEIEQLRLQKGDILFNEGGDRDKLGRGWIWQDQLPECIHQNHVFRARLLDASIRPKFVSWYGNTFGQRYFMDQGKQTTNLASINITKLSALPVPLPPNAEQERIAEEVERRLSVIEQMEALVETNLKRAETLRQSILRMAFSGRLTDAETDNDLVGALAGAWKETGEATRMLARGMGST
jgi:type I restriction enzyme S subunit